MAHSLHRPHRPRPTTVVLGLFALLTPAATVASGARAGTRAAPPSDPRATIRVDTPVRDPRDAPYARCAPRVHPATLAAVIAVESGGDPLALNINRGPRVRARTRAEAIALAERAIRAGYSVDIGLMQVNSRNLGLFGPRRLTVAEAFEPCTNLRAGSTLLADAYAAAAARLGEGQVALRAALSAYNTGDFARGFRNGYVARYYALPSTPPAVGVDAVTRVAATMGEPGPNAIDGAEQARGPEPLGDGRLGAAASADPYTAPTTVYRRARDTAPRR